MFLLGEARLFSVSCCVLISTVTITINIITIIVILIFYYGVFAFSRRLRDGLTLDSGNATVSRRDHI